MNTFTVYASQVEDVRKRLDRLAKKAANYSVPFSYTVGDVHPETVRVHEIGYGQGVSGGMTTIQREVNRYTVEAVDVEVECDGLIKANGWTVCAKIEHGAEGNIVTGFGSGEIDRKWYKVPAGCEHCGVNRFRSVTFLCKNEGGEIRQVGRTCLHDYTGISPATAAMWAEVRDIFGDGLDCTESEWSERSIPQMYEVTEILAHACDAITEFGYRKSAEFNSTREQVSEKMTRREKPSAEGKAKAAMICDWLIGRGEKAAKDDAELEDLWNLYCPNGDEGDERYWGRARELNDAWDAVSDMERNCVPMVKSGYATMKRIGLLAYMPVAYDRFMERKAKAEQREAERAAAASTSRYVGEVGKRVTITAASAALVTSWEGYYGVTLLYRFTDGDGNVFIWKSSRSMEVKDGMKIRGTVKQHSEYNGIRQTVLTRCTTA